MSSNVVSLASVVSAKDAREANKENKENKDVKDAANLKIEIKDDGQSNLDTSSTR